MRHMDFERAWGMTPREFGFVVASGMCVALLAKGVLYLLQTF